MDDFRKVVDEYEKTLKAVRRANLDLKKTMKTRDKVNTARVSIRGLLVLYYHTAFSTPEKMLVKPEFIKLFYKINDGDPFDISLWEELSQKERSFMYRITSSLKPDNSRELAERHCKEAKQFYNKVYINENQARLGNDSPEVYQELKDSIKELIDRHMITRRVGNNVIRQYESALGKIKSANNI